MRRGMPKMRGANFGTPAIKLALSLATRLAQQGAIAAPHQGKTGFYQADGAVAQVVALPGPFGDMPGAEQALRDFAIAVAFDAAVERAQRERQSLSPLWGQFMKGRTGWAPVERQPETPRGMAANLEITIEHQFSGVSRGRDRRILQP